MSRRIVVTGAAGFIGRQVMARLEAESGVESVIGIDVLPGPGVVEMDVRDPGLSALVAHEGVDSIVHLAAVVTPRPEHTREFLYSVDVEGTANVVATAIGTGVGHLTVTSSGAAYGYHPDSPQWIEEEDDLRGNPEFAYSDHKRLVEENLARVRVEHPALAQLILRPGTILGADVDNQVTALFERPIILGITGSPTPFVFIWDSDVVEVIVKGVLEQRTGIYNLAGAGAVPLREIARRLGKRYLPLPAGLVKAVLAGLKPLRLTRYGPEQVDFLRYRPVLSNRRLIEEFGYQPTMTSLEVLESWKSAHG